MTGQLPRGAAILALSLASAGFSSTALFDEPAAVGGGGGFPFTGSPTAHGLDCASCHQGSPRGDGVALESEPPGLFSQGFEPGATYVVRLALLAERRGLDVNGACPPHAGGCNRNGFVAEWLDHKGGHVGALCTDGAAFGDDGHCLDSAGPTTALLSQWPAISGHSLSQPQVCGAPARPGCVDVAAMRASGFTQDAIDAALLASVRGRTEWSFQWRAPAVGAGGDAPTTLWLGLVDGDGGVGVDPAHNDYFGDETYLLRREVLPLGMAPAAAAIGGCSATRRAGSTGGCWFLLGALPFALGLARRNGHRRWRGAAAVVALTLLATLRAVPASAADTSCDITTGASCLWGEGCDCDHDGYVRDTGKAKKYCHFSKCPLDSNDNDPKKLGKVSSDNADGDGWTTAYDCDDADPCVGKTCGASTCAVAIDADKDGAAADVDCDDGDANVHPGATVACCNCDILGNPAQAQTFGCSSGCPLSNPPPDAGPTDAGGDDAGGSSDSTTADAGSGDATSPDAAGGDTTGADAGTDGAGGADAADADAAADVASPADAALDDAWSPDVTEADAGENGDAAESGAPDADTGASPAGGGDALGAGAGADIAVGGGVLSRPPPPAPGCSAAARVPASGSLGLTLVGLALAATMAVRRRRRALVGLGVALALGGGISGCAVVKPWQREQLAHRCMIFGYHGGEQTLEQHAFQYREGAAGGFGGGGGGCGCN